MELTQYEMISHLFDYPTTDYRGKIADVAQTLKAQYPSASEELEELLIALPTDIYRVQELYTKSFEVQAVTSLEIGYVLYGDDYTRGEILANLSAEHQKVNNPLGGELADHLGNVLRLISKLEEGEFLDDLVKLLVAPAVENMIREFTPSSIRQKESFYKKQYKTLIVPKAPLGTYLHLLKALYIMLDSDFELIKENRPFQDVSFFGFLKKELEVEEGKKSSNSCSMSFNSCGTPIGCGI